MKTQFTSRQVIENKLLDALTDSSQVAILATEQDLEDMIAALCGYEIGDWIGPAGKTGSTLSWENHTKRKLKLAEGLKQLKDAAFPKL